VDLLNPVEARVLDALIEKAITTPEYYPLSLNALTNACNQSTNRDPVVHYDEASVAAAIETLRSKDLVHIVHCKDSRVTRYRPVVDETWGLSPAEIVAMGVLMLRGPQTVGEIRTRSARSHNFGSLDEVEAGLNALIAREADSLVARFLRQSGQKEVRYVHLLAGEFTPDPAEFAEGELPPASSERLSRLEDLTEELQTQLEDLRQQFEQFRKEFS
jgi:uncharacterized protein YceH (UPF0502 family)